MFLDIFDSAENQQYFKDETELIWLHGTLLCKRLGFKNVSQAIQMHTEEDERQQIVVNGRNIWFVSEYGVWGLILESKTEEALIFKKKLKRDILPKLRASSYYILPTATSEQLEAAQKEIEKFKQKEQWLRQENQKLIDSNELMWEGELRQLVKLFVKFAVKEYTSGKNYEYPIQFLDNFSIAKPSYSFERYWLAYWKIFKKYSRIPGMPCEYSGALDLDSLNLWRILQEVNVELSNSGDYRKLKHQGCQINFNNYTQSLKVLELN